MLKNKAVAVAFSVFLMLAFVVSLVAVPAANAHDPPWEIPTWAYISVSPNPVGVNQIALIVMWVDQMPYGTNIQNDIRFHDYKLTITDPDGKNETITWETVWDTTSSAYYAFTPDETGEYKLTFEFPEQTYTWSGDYQNDIYLASRARTTLTVQEEPIETIPDTPLPTEYWTRPIEGQNTNWFMVASNWLGSTGLRQYTRGIQPDGVAPNSAHIMWTKPIQFGGVVGGSNTGVEGMGYYTGLSYEARFNNVLIINGMVYYALPRGNSGTGGGYICVDLRTGEEIWRQNYAVDPTFGQLEYFDSPNQHGIVPNGYLWASPRGENTWIAYDPFDGNWLFNITDVPSGDTVYGPNGEMLIYVLDVENGWLALWNFTQVLTNGAAGALSSSGYRPVGRVYNSSERDSYSWNVTISSALNIPGSQIQHIIVGDMILGSGSLGYKMSGRQGIVGMPLDPYWMWAISLEKGSVGTLKWIKSYSAPPNNVTRMMGPVDDESRVFIMHDKETRQWSGYNLDDGTWLWGPVGDHGPFDYYTFELGDSLVGSCAYGKLYHAYFDGVLRCYDSLTGDLLWTYGDGGEGNSTNSGAQTPWGRYPLNICGISDGKIYVLTNEHSPNMPLYRGALVRCINATDGTEIWTIDSWAGAHWGRNVFFIADGYAVYLNQYDMQVYCIGKGPSSTTVTASPKVSIHGSSVLVEGSVIDIAAGTNQNEQAARFPNGVPAVSDESMGEWMEYVYMQKAKPSEVTGVEVVITVLDPNGNAYEVARTTSDSSGYFGATFVPEVPGFYKVIASFEGSKAYYGSSSETFLNVEAAPQPTTAPTPTPAPMTDTYVLGIGAGAIVAIVVIGLVIILMLRRR